MTVLVVLGLAFAAFLNWQGNQKGSIWCLIGTLALLLIVPLVV